MVAISLCMPLGNVQRASAVPASPHPFTVTQPDGTIITLYIKGDEYFHYMVDTAGFTVVRDKGLYKYARVNQQGELVPTQAAVGRDDPRQIGLSPGVLPPPSVIAQRRATVASGLERNGGGITTAIAPAGTVKNVVILMRFTNHVGRTLPSNADFNTIFNAVGGDPVLAPTGSVRDAYLELSYGILTLNSTVFG